MHIISQKKITITYFYIIALTLTFDDIKFNLMFTFSPAEPRVCLPCAACRQGPLWGFGTGTPWQGQVYSFHMLDRNKKSKSEIVTFTAPFQCRTLCYIKALDYKLLNTASFILLPQVYRNKLLQRCCKWMLYYNQRCKWWSWTEAISPNTHNKLIILTLMKVVALICGTNESQKTGISWKSSLCLV